MSSTSFCETYRAETCRPGTGQDRKSTRLNSSHANISYAVFCLKKKNTRPDWIVFPLTNDSDQQLDRLLVALPFLLVGSVVLFTDLSGSRLAALPQNPADQRPLD